MNTFLSYILLGALSFNSVLMFLTINQYIGLNGLNVLINFVIMILIGGLLLFKNKLKVVSYNYTDLIFYLFVLFGVLASLINSDFIVLSRIIFYSVLYFVFLKLLPSVFSRQQLFNMFFNTLILLYTLVILLPKILPSQISTLFYYTEYKGLFVNPNHLGIAAVTFLTILIVKYYSMEKENKSRKNMFEKTIVLILILFTFFELLTAASRNAFLNLIIIVLAFIVVQYVIKIRKNKIRSQYIIVGSGLLVIIISSLLVYFQPIYDYLYENILFKFYEKAEDPFDGRISVWSTIINDSNLLGNGRDYADSLSIAPHNTFMYFLAESGWLTASLLLLFFIFSLGKGFLYYSRNSSENVNILPFLIILLFLCLSIAENVYLHTITYLAFFQIGMLNSKTDVKLTKNKL